MTDRSVSDKKRNAILDAARTVFSRDGYAASSVDDVAAEAGIAKGTVYLYFQSKEDLYFAALLRDVKAYSSEGRTQIATLATLREKIENFLRAKLDYCRAHQDFLRIYLTEYNSMCAQTPIAKQMRQLQRDNLRYMTGVIETAVKTREIRPVPAAPLAAKVYDIARGLMERQLLGWKEFQVKDEVAFAADLLWHGIESQGRSGRKR